MPVKPPVPILVPIVSEADFPGSLCWVALVVVMNICWGFGLDGCCEIYNVTPRQNPLQVDM